jgi:hypothetical protein
VTESRPPAWGGDPSIAWRILLTAVPTTPLTVERLAERQAALHLAQGWPAPPPVSTGEPVGLRRDLAEVRDVPLVVGLAGDQVVVSAFHAYVDGRGLLDVLAALVDSPVVSSARGIADRPREGSLAGRLAELAFAPPARISLSPVVAADGDAYAVLTFPEGVRTSALVHAAVGAVVAHNDAAGSPSRHVTVGVGAGPPVPEGGLLANRSALLRLRDLEGLSPAEVNERLRNAPLSGAGGSGASGGRLTGLALRMLAPRLGSTLLVSHLGDVTTNGADELAFYPVTAGGTGLSLGAVAHDGATTLTLRGRATAWDEPGLQRLLDRVADALV